jgi:hypothetical protein
VSADAFAPGPVDAWARRGWRRWKQLKLALDLT